LADVFSGVANAKTSFATFATSAEIQGLAPATPTLAPRAAPAAGRQKVKLPKWVRLLLLVTYVYVDSSTTLWMQAYRKNQVERWQEGCNILDAYLQPHAAHTIRSMHQSREDTNERRLDAIVVDDAEILVTKYEKRQVADCSWFIQRDGVDEPWVKRPHTFTKGTALSSQALFGLFGSWAFSYYSGHLHSCFDIRGLCRFSMVGALFGFSAVCSFLAQDALSPGSYALYAQGGIVAIAVLWRLVFRKALPLLTWAHIFMILTGILMYRISEFDRGSDVIETTGIFWVVLKIGCTGCASVICEKFLKSEPSLPLCVQMSYIFPWKAFTCFLTIFVLPPYGLPADRPGGFFHDWTLMTLAIVAHNFGDTLMSAVIAKVFDSVVKAVCGVVGIIFPTWAFSWSMGWEELDILTQGGQLKASGAIIVVFSSYAYVLGRQQSRRMEKLRDALSDLQGEYSFGKQYGELQAKRLMHPRQ
jgi:multidrug transporter EmrE-like cation transporter